MQTDERSKLLRKINSSGLAMFDASLFLDSHPNNQDALQYYQKHKTMKEQAEKEYTSKYGPLSIDMVEPSANRWTWIDNPWPWEYREDK